MKKRFYICSNYLTVLLSLYAIEKSNDEGENHLLLLTNYCKQEYYDDMKNFSFDYNIFATVSILDDYENKQTHDIDFEKFKQENNIDVFDEIYATCYYDQAIKFMEYFDNADLYFLSNGLASYFPQKDSPEFYTRFKGFYYIKYFDMVNPFLCIEEGIKSIPVEKEFLIDKFAKIAEKIDIEPVNGKSIIFCTQNLFFNNKYINPKAEFDEYVRVIQNFINQGYTVYLKDHPRTPNVFGIYMQHPKIISLKDYNTYPVEALIYKLRPTNVVSLFSTALFNAYYLFNIPGFSYEFNLPLKNMFLLGHVMTKSYFYTLGSKTNDLIKIDALENQVLFEVLLFALSHQIFSESKFLNLQKKLQNIPFAPFTTLKIKLEFYNLLKTKSYQEYVEWTQRNKCLA